MSSRRPTPQDEFASSLDRLGKAIANGGRNYRELRFLVIDDMATVRSTLQILLQALGATQIDITQSHWDALHRIKQRMPDVILCDYNLGDSRTGQQLLEELRREEMLSEGVIFLMVTAETQYPQVVAAVELAPDDYVIKTFTANTLHARLAQLILKKAFFRPYYEQAIRREYGKAVVVLEDLLLTPESRPYRYECERLIAENLLRSDQLDEAEERFQALVDEGDFPWAKLGLARCLVRREELARALNLCEEAIEAAPLYTNAYDLKAQIHANLGEHEAARDTVNAALAIAPLNFERKRRVMDYALKAGDHATAQEIMRSMVQSPQDIEKLSLQDRLSFARAELAGGNKDAAAELLSKIERRPMMPFEEQISIMCLMVQANPDKGAAEFNRLRQRIAFTPLPSDTSLDVVRACMVIPDMQVAQMVSVNVLSGPDRRSTFPVLNEIFLSAERKTLFQRIKQEAAENLKNMPAKHDQA